MAEVAAAHAGCFHCGLPAGGARFCCTGCEAISGFIAGAGLADYYSLRSGVAAPFKPGREADLLLYDDPSVQARFVRSVAGSGSEAELVVEGIRCAACAWLIEQAVSRVAGVESIAVNATTRDARLRWNPAVVPLSALFATIRRIGYDASPRNEGAARALELRERRALLRRIWVAALGMMQVMMYAVPAYLAAEGDITPDLESLMRWAGLLLTAPVLAYSAAPFFRGAWRDLRLARIGMDVPVALGLAVAFAASAWATLRGSGAVYFDSVTMFVFLLLGGRYLEHVARSRAADSLRHLGAFVPQGAWRLTDETRLESEHIPAALLKAGDRILVRAGETLPADGVLASPEALVSEALLSGESRILQRREGARLIGGAVNSGSAFVMRVTHVGGDTVMGAIRRLVERAAGERPRWVQAADRASGIFVAAILATAALAAATWLVVDPSRALWIAVSVLIVTCPCALSLAAPVAVTVATGALARRNLVATRANAIEALAAATDFVFDKTGTLTAGTPRVLEVMPFADLPEARCLAIAAALGRVSAHPLDGAIVAAAANGARLTVSGYASRPGEGAQGVVDGCTVRIGRAAYVAQLAGKPAPVAWLHANDTVVWLADGHGWIAAFRLGDALRPEAPAAVRSLRRAGVTVHLLTGDEPRVARAIAERLGIDHVEARATPERKQAYVKALQSRGARVAMTGDGVNDAPVLAQADVSIAMGGGADLAQVHADAVLLSDSLTDLVDAVALARRARSAIRQNIAWAVGYNAIVIPMAFAGMVTPLVAGIGMSLSSLVVVGNALRLRA